MKIMIDDGMQIQVGTGIGKYSRYLYDELKKALSNKDEVNLLSFSSEKSERRMFSRILYLLYINSKKYRDKCKSADIVHFTNYAIPVFRQKGMKYAVTVHDLVSFIYPETLPRIYGIYSRWIIKYAVKHADIVFTDSKAAKNDILQRFNKYRDKINVAYPGLYEEYKADDNGGEAHIIEKYNLKKNKYFIFVGTIEKRKNISILIDGFAQLKHNFRNEHKLVLVGRPGRGYDEFKSQAAQSSAFDDIIFTGYISSSESKALYKNASAYVFPTIYEGFGSTQLECMANHIPLICSDIPTNREISGDYGLYFDLSDTDSLVKQMKKIVDGKYDYESRAKVADSIVERFKWENVIGKYIEAYREGADQQRN